MAKGIRRLGLLLTALAGIAIAALAAISWLVDQNAVRAAVERQVRAATGLDLTANGTIEVSVFPGSYVTMHDVTLGTGQAPPLRVETLTANLRLLPLLTQRFQIADVMLYKPRISVTRAADGTSNWTPLIARLAETLKPDATEAVSFSEIRVSDGILTYADATRDVAEAASGIEASLAWPSISRSFAATGEFDWRGQRVDGSLGISDFRAALAGEKSGLKIRITAAPLKFAFDGSVSNPASLLLEGTVSADSPSLRNALRWAGREPPGAGGFGRFALKARAHIVGPSVALTNVNVELDDNVAEGVMTLTGSERQSLQATLAAEALDLTPYLHTIRLLASGARDWNRQIFDLSGLSATDLDMRLSAARVAIGSMKLGRTALGANLRNGTLALSVGEAQMFDGIAKGSVVVARADAGADIKTQFQFTEVDLEACLGELLGTSRLAGRGDLKVTLEASGASPYGLAQSLNGDVVLTGRNGALNGFNVEQLLHRLERRPLSGGGNFRTGHTPFDTLKVAVHFADGTATADDIRIEGPGARLILSGTASVPAREFDMKGVAGLVTKAGQPPGFELPFVVQGPWDDPLIFPDSDSLIRRSPASAPLLDAVRDRRARDAVRAVIERFTGAAKPVATPPSPAAAANQ
jgi:AsmA protein